MPKVVFRTGKRIIGGKAELYIRFYYGAHENVRSASGIFVPIASWSEKDQRLLYKSRAHTHETSELVDLNRRIDDMRSYIEDAYTNNPFIRSTDWLRDLVCRFYNPTSNERTPVTELCTEYAKKHKLAPGSVKQYNTLRSHLVAYGELNGTLYVETMTVEDVEDLELYLRERMGHNTVVNKLKKLKSVCNWAFKTGRTDNNPFSRYTLESESYGDPVSLTYDEREKLYRFDGLTEAMAVQRDIFIFQCHVGCRVSDLVTFTPDNITKDGCLQYIPLKTRGHKHNPVVVPLSDTAKEIIRKYEGTPNGKLLPFVSDIHYNEAIHASLRLAGIDRIVIVQDPRTQEPRNVPIWQIASSHMARKTFSDIVFEVTGSDTVVASLTGHSLNSQSLKHYRKVKRNTQKAAIDKMDKGDGIVTE